MAFDKSLLEVIACPVCKGKLIYQEIPERLVCRFDHRAYPIKEGIPVLLEDEGQSINLDELS